MRLDGARAIALGRGRRCLLVAGGTIGLRLKNRGGTMELTLRG
jgi:hypothetical protein